MVRISLNATTMLLESSVEPIVTCTMIRWTVRRWNAFRSVQKGLTVRLNNLGQEGGCCLRCFHSVSPSGRPRIDEKDRGSTRHLPCHFLHDGGAGHSRTRSAHSTNMWSASFTSNSVSPAAAGPWEPAMMDSCQREVRAGTTKRNPLTRHAAVKRSQRAAERRTR